MACASCLGCLRCAALLRLGRFCRSDKPSSRYRRYTRKTQVHMALPTQHHVHPAVAIVHARVDDLLDASPQYALVLALGDVQIGRCRHAHDAQSLTLAAPKALHEIGHQLASLGGPQSFFATTACSMVLSRLRSATICLSLRFSSSSWRKRRSSEGPTPP